MEHTQRKWEVIPYTRRDGNNIRWVKDEKGREVCQTFKPNAEANARLISAAPDLLAMCRKLKRTLRDTGTDAVINQVIEGAEQVIAKAEKQA